MLRSRNAGQKERSSSGLVFFGFFLGLLFMPFLDEAIAILREGKESYSHAYHLFTDLEGWLPDCSDGQDRTWFCTFPLGWWQLTVAFEGRRSQVVVYERIMLKVLLCRLQRFLVISQLQREQLLSYSRNRAVWLSQRWQIVLIGFRYQCSYAATLCSETKPTWMFLLGNSDVNNA